MALPRRLCGCEFQFRTYRQRIGAMERVRVRFELMSFDDRVKLCDFLDQKYG